MICLGISIVILYNHENQEIGKVRYCLKRDKTQHYNTMLEMNCHMFSILLQQLKKIRNGV